MPRCDLLSQFNSGNNEHNYAQALHSRITLAIPDFNPRFVIDTGRNGVDSAIRQDCANWCNIRGAGLGREPTAATQLPGLVDAYFWLKTPGPCTCTRTPCPCPCPCPCASMVARVHPLGPSHVHGACHVHRRVGRMHGAVAGRLGMPALRSDVRVGRLDRVGAW